MAANEPPPPRPKKKAPRGRPDLATLGGLALAAFGILGGLVLEGGSLKDVAQVTAALIVFGGTAGACMVTTPLDVLIRAVRKAPEVFLDRLNGTGEVIDAIIAFATKARRNGIVSLEAEAETIPDPFFRKALTLAIDGTDIEELREMMELEIAVEESRGEAEAKVYEAAGGYAPTIGIIGAVLGLIQVMKHLENIEEVGRGIAVAFVATVYGVGAANILFLPAAAKLKARMSRSLQEKEMILEGVVGIVEGLNPKLIRSKLGAYLKDNPDRAKDARARQAAATAAQV